MAYELSGDAHFMLVESESKRKDSKLHFMHISTKTNLSLSTDLLGRINICFYIYIYYMYRDIYHHRYI